jgi:cell division protein FtsX
MLGILPNPYVLLALVMFWLSSVGFAFYKGHQYADRSAEIATLQKDLSSAQALATELRIEAVTARAIADRASTRATSDEQDLRDLQEKIDALITNVEAKPVVDQCRIDDAEYLSLSDLAAAARAGKTRPAKLPPGARPR